jgi:uncharacterized protein with PIN domain
MMTKTEVTYIHITEIDIVCECGQLMVFHTPDIDHEPFVCCNCGKTYWVGCEIWEKE